MNRAQGHPPLDSLEPQIIKPFPKCPPNLFRNHLFARIDAIHHNLQPIFGRRTYCSVWIRSYFHLWLLIFHSLLSKTLPPFPVLYWPKIGKNKNKSNAKNNAKLGNNVNRFAAPTWMVPSSTMLLTCKCPFFCFYYVNKVVCASTNPCIFGVYFYRTFAVIKALWIFDRSIEDLQCTRVRYQKIHT